MTAHAQMARRQHALADFGEFALGSDDLDEVLTEACRLVGEALGTRRAKVLEIQDGGTELLVRAGIGWKPEDIGRLRLAMSENSSEAFSIRAGRPVITNDVSTETRFAIPSFMADAGVRAMANVPIFVPGRRLYGLLQVDATQPRDFTGEDTEFLRTYATILGPVIDRLQTVHRLREAEDRERRREIRFRTIFDTAPVGLSVIDADGRFLRVNKELSRILGRPEIELVAHGVQEVTHAPDIPRSVEALERSLHSGETVTLDKSYRRPDGELVPASSSLTRLPDRDGPPAVLAVTVDLTGRYRAEQALRDSEERLRLALDAGRLATWDWHLESNRILWSPEHFRMEGYEVGAVEPSYEVWADRVHAEDLPGAEAALARARDEQTPYRHEFRIVLADGTLRWISAEGQFFYDEAGKPLRMIGVQRDVTLQREWQEMQAVTMAELQHRTRNLIGVVRSIADQTMVRTDSMERFRSEFSHRLDALSRVQGLLSRLDETRVTIGDIVRLELDALGDPADDRISAGGPAVAIRKSVVQILSLALHELATNARKYGALAGRGGRLSVHWETMAMPGGDRLLRLHWIESGVQGMPSADQAPKGGGYGRQLIEKALPYQLQASTSYELAPDGVRCRIDLPLTTP